MDDLLDRSDFVEDELVGGEDASVLCSVGLEGDAELSNGICKRLEALALRCHSGCDILHVCAEACEEVSEQ